MDTQPTYKVTELVGTSNESVDDAIKHGLARAAATVRNLDWFEVSAIRGRITEGTATQIQVIMKVGFRLEE
jgi:flavin-binding protein dodecin